MNLLLRALIDDIRELAKRKDIQNFRVDYKRNKRGDLVIALIVADHEGPLGSRNVP